MNTILTYVGSQLEFDFFSRFVKPLKELDVNLVMVTTKPSLYLRGKLKEFDIHIIKYSQNDAVNENIYFSKEVKLGTWKINLAARFFNALFEFCEQTFNRCAVINVFIWSNYSIPSIALSEFAKLYNIKQLYFEQSNIHRKIFVDPLGTNFKSLLFKNPEILDAYEVSENEYLFWKTKYLKKKKNETNTPLGKKTREIQNFCFIIDSLGSSMFAYPKIGEMNILKKLNELFKRRKNHFVFDEHDVVKGDYIFFPMQVTTDSQVIFNTTFPLLEAVNVAIERAREFNCTLLIKPHPVELDQQVYSVLNEYRTKYGCKIVNMPSIELVEHSRLVITINSTVGLEALIMEKKVEFLGKSFYAFLNGKRIKNYLMRYLVNVDYFSKTNLSVGQIKDILAKNEIG